VAQFLRPDSNVTRTSWTNGFAEIDEATASDADFAYGANNSSTATLEVGLSNPITPQSGTCTVRWRYAKVSSGTLSGTGGTVNQTCAVYQGASLITSSTVTTGGTWTAGSFTFSTSSITNWNDLQLRFTQTASGGGGNARGSAVSWAEIETPDAGYSTTGDTGAFDEAGQDAGLLKTSRLVADASSFALTGQDAALTVGTGASTYTLAADAGSAALTGQDAGLNRGYSLPADAGAFSEAGQAAGLNRGISLPVDAGAVALAGQDVTTSRGIVRQALTGEFTLAGQDATFGRIYSFITEAGDIAVTGQDAGLPRSYLFDVEAGSLALTGKDVDSIRGRIVPAWTASTSVSVGTLVKPTVFKPTGLLYICTVAGTTGSTEPVWTSDFGVTVPDGGVTWQAVSMIAGNLQEVAPSSIIELFQLELNSKLHGVNETYYFHAGSRIESSANLIWNGIGYNRFPIQVDGFEHSGNGQLPRPKLQVSNIFGTITALLVTLPNGLEGAKVTRIRTLARYLDGANWDGGVNPYGVPDPSAEFPREIYYIDRKVIENRDVVEFELAAAFDLAGVRAPKRQCIANICQWQYKSAECGYTGALATCSKTLDDCKVHFGDSAELPFGSFPGIGTYFT
jgi:lambda family phage minor tail protein L